MKAMNKNTWPPAIESRSFKSRQSAFAELAHMIVSLVVSIAVSFSFSVCLFLSLFFFLCLFLCLSLSLSVSPSLSLCLSVWLQFNYNTRNFSNFIKFRCCAGILLSNRLLRSWWSVTRTIDTTIYIILDCCQWKGALWLGASTASR